MGIFLQTGLIRGLAANSRFYSSCYQPPRWLNQDYEAARENFHLEIPPRFNFAHDVIGKWAKDPQKLAMLWVGQEGQERKITFDQLNQRSSQAAHLFNHLGIKKGDRALVMLPRIPEWWESTLGLLKLGAIPIPSTTQLTPKDIQFRISDADIAGLIVDSEGFEKTRETKVSKCRVVIGDTDDQGWTSYPSEVGNFSSTYLGEETKSDDPAMLYFTSATTGPPKKVLHTHTSCLGHMMTSYWLDLQEGDLLWNLSDLGWAKAAWSSFFAPWLRGIPIFVHDTRGNFSAANTLKMLHTHPITTFCASPTAYRMMILKDSIRYLQSNPPHSLRRCVAAGEPLNAAVIKVWKETTGTGIATGYGQTETVLTCAEFPSLAARPGSMGKPSPGINLDIIDTDGNPLSTGVEGDIAVRIKPERPPGMFAEYWRDPNASTSCIRGDWYLTGDRGYKDADGYFHFVGRASDIIKSSGYRIGPFEVESALKEHPAVAESAVVGAPDTLRGEIVVAYVILSPGYSPSPELKLELQNHVKETTAPYKYPREIIFVDELPKTISGKIQRAELRKRLRGSVEDLAGKP